MPRTEPKRPIGIPESVFDKIEKYATEHSMFNYEVICKMWEVFSQKITLPVKRKRSDCKQ